MPARLDCRGRERVIRVADKLGQLHIQFPRRRPTLRVLNQRALRQPLKHKPSDKTAATVNQRHCLLRLQSRQQTLISRVGITQPPMQLERETQRRQFVLQGLQARTAF